MGAAVWHVKQWLACMCRISIAQESRRQSKQRTACPHGGLGTDKEALQYIYICMLAYKNPAFLYMLRSSFGLWVPWLHVSKRSCQERPADAMETTPTESPASGEGLRRVSSDPLLIGNPEASSSPAEPLGVPSNNGDDLPQDLQDTFEELLGLSSSGGVENADVIQEFLMGLPYSPVPDSPKKDVVSKPCDHI